jgi:hypothetical protein
MILGSRKVAGNYEKVKKEKKVKKSSQGRREKRTLASADHGAQPAPTEAARTEPPTVQ